MLMTGKAERKGEEEEEGNRESIQNERQKRTKKVGFESHMTKQNKKTKTTTGRIIR